MELILEKLNKVKGFVFDVDGVMTTGQVLVTEEGYQLRSMFIKDGYALQHAVKSGYPIAIISGGKSSGIVKRFEGLGIKDIYIGQSHKEKAFGEFLEKYKLTPADILYMGDDLPDYPLLKICGVSTCPKDAATDILEICAYVSPFEGGRGCVRDVIEKTLKVQQKWSDENSFHW